MPKSTSDTQGMLKNANRLVTTAATSSVRKLKGKQIKSSLQVDHYRVPLDSSEAAPIEAAVDSLEKDTMGTSWYDVLEPEFDKPYFLQVGEAILAQANL